jgi:uncharacterized protein YndB with AHSA1/START domain
MSAIFDPPITHSILVRAEPERIYDALTTGDGLDSWFTTGATVDRQPGGAMHWRWQDWGADRINAEDHGTVLEVQRPDRFVFTWHPNGPEFETTVAFDFIPDERGTIVRLREEGYPDTPSGRRGLLSCATGWGEALTLVKFFLEHGARY